ncbi:mechanosensitive ion channel family protein [Streptomyces sp. ME03-5709C]|nr:mechanosensitive ion channel family protein [Streptomyces sp. ME03-5709C]
MNRALTLHDLVAAGAAIAVGALAGLLLRLALKWLGERATRTRWGGDDIVVAALRTVVPWAALATGAWAGAAALPLTRVVDRTVNQVLVAVMILAATIAAGRMVAETVRTLALARSGVAASATIFVNITRVVVLAIGFLVLLQTLGISVTPLITALGVGGLAVALALQDTLANLFAGVHILASKTVQPGDYIRLSSGEEGYVVDINWRNTVVRQLSDNLVIIPNAKLASAIATNFHQPEQQMSLIVQAGVGYDNDLEHVERVTVEVAVEVMAHVEGGIPGHEAAVRFHTFGESRIDFSVILRTTEYGEQYRIKHEFIKRLHRRYQEEGIDIAFPTRNVVLRQEQPEAMALPHQRAVPAMPDRTAGI